MATARQKQAARRNLEKARQVQSGRAHGAKIPRLSRVEHRSREPDGR